MAMVDAYTIGINLEVKGSATASLDKFSELAKKTTLNVKELTDQLRFLNRTFMRTDELVMGAARAMRIFGTRSAESLRAARVELKEFNTQLGVNAALASKGGGAGLGRIGGGLATRLGVGAIVAGAATFGLMDIFKAQERFAGAQAQFAAQGFGAGVTNRAVAASRAARIPGVSQTDFLRAQTDALVVTRDPTQAALLAPIMARQGFANKILAGQAGRSFGRTDEAALASAAEIRTGSTNAGVISRQLNFMEKMLTSEGFRIPASSFKQFFAYAGPVGKTISDMGLAALSPEIQQMGGGKTGIGIRQAGAELSSTMSLKKLREFEKLGIINPGDVVMHGRGHAILKPGTSFTGSKLFSDNPALWVTNVLMPLLKSHGFATVASQQTEVMKLFGARGGRIISDLMMQPEKILKAMQTVPGAAGTEGAFKLAQKTPAGEVMKLTAAWDSFTTSLGRLAMPKMITGLKALTDFINILSTTLGNIHGFVKHGVPTFSSMMKPISKEFLESHTWRHGHSKHSPANTIKTAPTQSSKSGQTVEINLNGIKLGEAVIPIISNLMNKAPSYSTLVNSHDNLWPTSMNMLGASL